MRDRSNIGDDVVRQMATRLKLDDPAKIAHLSARLERYAGGYLAARRGLRIRLSPGGRRTYMLLVAGHIAALEGDIVKLADIDEVIAECRTIATSGPDSAQCPLDELRGQLRFLRELVGNLAEDSPHERSQKGLSILDHAVGSFLALFNALTGARVGVQRTPARGDPSHRLGQALREVFQTVDPEVSQTELDEAIDRLNSRFPGRELQERDFDWISAIEDDGGFDVSWSRTPGQERSTAPS
jgi:hypothetical protein